MSNIIAGIGTYLPERVVTNADLEAMDLDYDRTAAGGASLDEWARTHHGAISRRWAAPDECTSDMATIAAQRALDDAGLDARDVDAIVMATITSDCRLPQAALVVQSNLGSTAKVIQVDSACTGFVDSLLVACGLLEVQRYETALVIGADTLTRLCHPRQFIPFTVFGDGAGAVVLQRHENNGDYGVRSIATGSEGHLGEYVTIPGGGGKLPLSQEVLDQELHYWRFKFKQIYSWAIERVVCATRAALANAHLTLDDVTWVVPHQPSSNILCDIAQRLDVNIGKFAITYPFTGNLSAASIPVALEHVRREGPLRDGDWLVMPAVGAGMAWGAVTYRWHSHNGLR